MTTDPCPKQEQLMAFLAGGLPDQQYDTVGAHVDACSICQDTVVSLGDESTSGTKKIAIARATNAFEQEPECQQAVELMKEVGRRQDTAMNEPTVTFSPNSDTHPSQAGSGPPIERLGVYQIVEPLGRGAMGVVYRALHTRLQREVAIKVLPAQNMQNEHAVARFDREMRVIGQLDHPNIVSARDADEDNGVHYLVMELVEGIDLSELLSKVGPLPVPDACEITRQAAEGLQYAHEHGLVHRDIKPSNLMVAVVRGRKLKVRGEWSAGRGEESNEPEIHNPKSAIVKILDLGLALLTQEPDQSALTSIGVAVGTIDYMAPEQFENTHGVDIRADIYGLGATLYKLLTGQAPFAGERYSSHLKKMAAIARDDPPPISDVRSDVPAELSHIVQRMMAREAAARYSTPAEVARALKPWAKHADLAALFRKGKSPGQPSSIDVSTGRKPAPCKIPRAMVGVGGGLLSVAVALSLVMLFRSTSKDDLNLYDLSGTDRYGTVVAATRGHDDVSREPLTTPTDTITRKGFALDFDGQSAHVLLPFGHGGPTPFTIEVTLDVPPTGQQGAIVANNDRSGLSVGFNKTQFNCLMQTHSRTPQDGYVRAISTTLPPVGTRVRLAAVFDRSALRLFVDGRLEQETPLDGSYVPSPYPFRIGASASHTGFDYPFAGRIFEVRISRTARYINRYAPADRLEPDDDTLALYEFKEGAGAVLHDSSGNGLHGTIIGATWVNADGSSIIDAQSAQQRPPNRKVDPRDRLLP